MKNLIFILITISMSGVSQAETAVFKAGGWPGAANGNNAGVTHGYILSIEPSGCVHCLSPFFTRLDNDYGTFDGLGVDYIYKLAHNPRNTFRLAFGIVGFDDPLNDSEAANIHIGLGFEMYTSDTIGIVLSADHFSNGRNALNRSDVDRNVATHFLSLGIHFR